MTQIIEHTQLIIKAHSKFLSKHNEWTTQEKFEINHISNFIAKNNVDTVIVDKETK
jgi:hypothetical protein